MSDSTTRTERADGRDAAAAAGGATSAGKKRSPAQIAAGLPDPVRGLVLEVVKRTRLWRREKRRVAAELVGHFEDGIAAGQSAAQLVAGFGEPAVVAKLIRRAQKRQRGWLWKTWSASWKGVVCLVVLYVAAGVYLATGRPVVSVDYAALLLREAESVPAEEAAWPVYREALGMLTAMPVARDPRGYETFDMARPGDDVWDGLAAYLRENTEALDLIRKASQRMGLGFDPRDIDAADAERWKIQPDAMNATSGLAGGALIGLLLPHLSDMRHMARLIAADMHEAVIAGDGERVADDVAALMGIGRHAREIPVLICALTGSAIENVAFEELRFILRENPALFSDDQLVELAHLMGSLDDRFEVEMRGERMFFHDIVQRLYTEGENGYITNSPAVFDLDTTLSGREDSDEWHWASLAQIGVLPAMTAVTASRGEITAEYERLMDAMEAEIRRPMWEWDGAVERELEEGRRGAIDRLSFRLVDVLIPSLTRAGAVARFAETERDGVVIAIALELHKRRHGAWPASLDELVPGLLPAAPVDPLNGESLRYRLREDGRPVVYSVGEDGDNDGGRPAMRGTRDHGPQPSRTRARELIGESEHPSDGDWVLYPVD